jgi:hypothetical protein
MENGSWLFQGEVVLREFGDNDNYIWNRFLIGKVQQAQDGQMCVARGTLAVEFQFLIGKVQRKKI